MIRIGIDQQSIEHDPKDSRHQQDLEEQPDIGPTLIPNQFQDMLNHNVSPFLL